MIYELDGLKEYLKDQTYDYNRSIVFINLNRCLPIIYTILKMKPIHEDSIENILLSAFILSVILLNLKQDNYLSAINYLEEILPPQEYFFENFATNDFADCLPSLAVYVAIKNSIECLKNKKIHEFAADVVSSSVFAFDTCASLFASQSGKSIENIQKMSRESYETAYSFAQKDTIELEEKNLQIFLNDLGLWHKSEPHKEYIKSYDLMISHLKINQKENFYILFNWLKSVLESPIKYDEIFKLSNIISNFDFTKKIDFNLKKIINFIDS